ncbi:MAG TPA: hypothetical protein VGI19_06915 [Candidatus Cybelea sp.]|jgi:hypothetical protein
MIDVERLSEEARRGVVRILEDVLAKGGSLYGSEQSGNLVEIAPDGRKYVFRIEGNVPVRLREIERESARYNRG